MHLLIPYASALSEGCRHLLKDLELPVLSRLLARMTPAERNEGDEYSLSPPHERVLARLLGYAGSDGGLPWAAHWAARDGIDTADLSWGLLTPTHWHVGADHITMLDPARLELEDAESRELLDAVRHLFESEGWVLVWGAPTRWYAAHESLGELPTASLDRVIGRNVDLWMPDHPQARLLRRLQNEVQMFLYTHPLTEQRLARGALPVNSFWLSGCGPRQPERPIPEWQVLDGLRGAAMNEDWVAWAEAWRTLDAGALATFAGRVERGDEATLVLCGERHAVHFETRPRSWSARLAQRFTRPAPAAQTLLSL